MTFFEFASWRASIVEREKLEWRRQSQLLSLIYNVNRGKGKKLGPSDFFPFDEEEVGGLQSGEDVQDLAEKIKAQFQSSKN